MSAVGTPGSRLVPMRQRVVEGDDVSVMALQRYGRLPV